MDQTVGGILVLGEREVQDAHRIDIFQMIVPLAFWSLFPNGIGGVIDAAVLEVLLLCLLHLDDDAAAVSQTAIDVEHRLDLWSSLLTLGRVDASITLL